LSKDEESVICNSRQNRKIVMRGTRSKGGSPPKLLPNSSGSGRGRKEPKSKDPQKKVNDASKTFTRWTESLTIEASSRRVLPEKNWEKGIREDKLASSRGKD